MTEHPHDPRERELISALKEVSRPVPDPEYRQRMRAAFVTASPSARRRRTATWAGAGLALAALLAVFLLRPEPLRWQAPPGTGVTVNGVPQTGPLRPGDRVLNPGPDLASLRVDDALALVLAPGTEVTLDASSPWLGAGSLEATVHAGHVLGRTHERFPEGGLTLNTDDAWIHVSGTTFGVVRLTEFTCICVYEGDVLAGPSAEGAEPVPSGNRLNVYGPEQAPDSEPLYPLSPLEESMLDALERDGFTDRRL